MAKRQRTFDCAFVDGDCAVPAQLTTTIRGLDGKVLRIYNQPFGGAWNWERDYVYRDGQLLASVEPRSDGGEDTVHFHLDHLGSPRQVTDEGGAQAAFHTYYPFGEEATVPSQDDVELKFTGHERDDNGSDGAGVLDYMHARYCSPALGRLLSVDRIVSSEPKLSQSWNKYTYSLSNPIRFVDPNGETVVVPRTMRGTVERGLNRSPEFSRIFHRIDNDPRILARFNLQRNAKPGTNAHSDLTVKSVGGQITSLDAQVTLPFNQRTSAEILGHELKHLEEILDTGKTLRTRFQAGDPGIWQNASGFESDDAKATEALVKSEISNYQGQDQWIVHWSCKGGSCEVDGVFNIMYFLPLP